MIETGKKPEGTQSVISSHQSTVTSACYHHIRF